MIERNKTLHLERLEEKKSCNSFCSVMREPLSMGSTVCHLCPDQSTYQDYEFSVSVFVSFSMVRVIDDKGNHKRMNSSLSSDRRIDQGSG